MKHQFLFCLVLMMWVFVSVAGEYTYIGCFTNDATDPALRSSASTTAITIDLCSSACKSARKLFFGVVDGECRCDNNLIKAKRYGSSSCDFELYSNVEPDHRQTGGTGLYPRKYNLIDGDPSCRYESPVFESAFTSSGEGWPAQCPDKSAGSIGVYTGAGDVDPISIAPNIVERKYYLMDNAARLFPDEFAVYPSIGFDARCSSDPAPAAEYPFYFMSEGVQAARFTRYSRAIEYSGCNATACDPVLTSHYTCCEYCPLNLWSECGYNYVGRAMTQLLFESNSWNDIGSANGGGGGGHCNVILNTEYNHEAYGYYPGGGGIERYGIKDTFDWEDHVFPHAMHYEEEEGGSLVFFVQWFGGKQCSLESPRTTNEVYILYDGQKIAMTREIGNEESGFYRYSTTTIPTECEPYAFSALDANGIWHRLPQEEEYFFATVSTPEDILTNTAVCEENHYFFTGSDWVANGGPLLQNLKTDASGNCVGCRKVSALQELEPTFEEYSPCPTAAPTMCPQTVDSTSEYGYVIGHTEECSWPFLTWEKAQLACQTDFGSELATFTTIAEYEAIVDLIGDNTVWIGLGREVASSTGQWTFVSDPETPCMNDTYLCVPESLWVDLTFETNDRMATLYGSETGYGKLQDTGKGNSKRYVCNPPKTTSAPTPEPTPETDSPSSPTTGATAEPTALEPTETVGSTTGPTASLVSETSTQVNTGSASGRNLIFACVFIVYALFF